MFGFVSFDFISIHNNFWLKKHILCFRNILNARHLRFRFRSDFMKNIHANLIEQKELMNKHEKNKDKQKPK